MAGILGAWRNGFAALMMTLLALFLVTVMQSGRFAEKARNIRLDLVNKVAEETIADPKIKDHVISESRTIPRQPIKSEWTSRIHARTIRIFPI